MAIAPHTPSPSQSGPDVALDILISGTGIAGPIAAYWLLRGNPSHRITLLERSPELRVAGQSVDIREAAVGILDKMDLIPSIRKMTTQEAGVRVVGDKGETLGVFPATGDVEKQAFTSEFEIFRGDLVQLFFDLIKDKVRAVFDDYVTDYTTASEAKGGRVTVTTKNGRLAKDEGGGETFDVVIACDGHSSRIRNIALGTTENHREHYMPFYNYAGYFTLPINLLGPDKMAVWYNDTKGRGMLIRPDTDDAKCRANILVQMTPGDDQGNQRYRDALAPGKGVDAIKEVLKEDFAGAHWKSAEVIDGMMAADDFYASETAQVRAPVLSKGRIAWVGDAGFCPTFFTGMGTSSAIIGAYILAGELTASPNDVEGALKRYNDITLPFARGVQGIWQSMPQYACPQTATGLGIQRWALWAAGKAVGSGLAGVAEKAGEWFAKLPGAGVFKGRSFEPPKYKWDTQKDGA